MNKVIHGDCMEDALRWGRLIGKLEISFYQDNDIDGIKSAIGILEMNDMDASFLHRRLDKIRNCEVKQNG